MNSSVQTKLYSILNHSGFITFKNEAKEMFSEDFISPENLLSERLNEMSPQNQGGICTVDHAEDATIRLMSLSHFQKEFELLPEKNDHHETYLLYIIPEANQLVLAANRARGFYYAIGKLLKLININESFTLPSDLYEIYTPEKDIRGQQLGYRPLNNTMDTWTPNQFKKYIEDLVLFGANIIELISPHTDVDDFQAVQNFQHHTKIPSDTRDYQQWPHIKYDFIDMLCQTSAIIKSYDLQCWLWYPNLGKFNTPEDFDHQLNEREKLFAVIPHLDALFIPSGDPGHLEANKIFHWCEKIVQKLHSFHPHAKIWLTIQSFHQTDEWLKNFLNKVNTCPSWLEGVAHSPWQKISLKELKSCIHPKLKIRHYPDITHNINCQYPLKNWDRAFALIYGREAINPRVKEFQKIHQAANPYVDGTVGYSEGVHDDINKFLWLDLDWCSTTPIEETLCTYAKILIHNKISSDFVSLIKNQENTWHQLLINNDHIEKDLERWQLLIKKDINKEYTTNFRFLLGYIRALSDTFIHRRWLVEDSLLKQVYQEIENKLYPKETLETYHQYQMELTKSKLYLEILAISDELFEAIGLQTSVIRHGNLAWNRGAFVDTLLEPINNLPFIKNYLQDSRWKNNQDNAIQNMPTSLYPQQADMFFDFQAGMSLENLTMTIDQNDHSCDKSIFYHYSPQLLHLLPEYYLRYRQLSISCLSHLSTRYESPVKIKINHLELINFRLEIAYVRQYFGKTNLTAKLNDIILEKNLLITDHFMVKSYDIAFNAINANGSIDLTFTSKNGELGPNIAYIAISYQK